MVAYTSTPIIDPDQLGYQVSTATVPVTFAAATEELLIDTVAQKIYLKVVGNLTTDGVTVKAVYSKLKDAWLADATLIKFPFPMGPITDEQFEMINGWNWDKVDTSGTATQTTVNLLRTGGWSVVTSGTIRELWGNVITLGALGSTDQVYYQQVDTNTPSADFVLTGPVNQSIQILSDPNGDGSYVDGYDRRAYLKLFVREWQKTYSQSELNDIGVSLLNYQAYRFPLTNSTDLKVTNTEGDVGTLEPFISVNITYLRDANNNFYNVRGTYNGTGITYLTGDVVQSSNGRWFKLNSVSSPYTSTATQPEADATNWSAYEGERQIGANWYAYTVVIDGDDGVAAGDSGGATKEQIYQAVQWRLRQDADIDSDVTGVVTGKTATGLLRFVGDTLVTSNGVYIDSFNANDTNAIEFFDYAGTQRLFPFVASLTINFGDNLQNDADAKYWVFFTNDDAGDNTARDFGTENAIIVEDNSTVPMTALISGAAFASRTYNYDGNVQRGGASAGTVAPITVVGIGLSTGQYVVATGSIERNNANSVSLVSPLERNYSAGTV